MAIKRAHNFLLGTKHLRSNQSEVMHHHQRQLCHHSIGEEESHDQEDDVYSSEWYKKAFMKMMKWNHSLKELDLVGGRLVNLGDHSRVYDEKLEKRMHMFKSVGRIFIKHPLVQETMRKNVIPASANEKSTDFHCFSKPHERDSVSVSSLTKVADILGVSAQQRKVVRHTICPQVTRYQIWTGALEEILSGLKSEMDVLVCKHPVKEINLARQIVVNCSKFLESSTSYDPESTSWMRLTPTKNEEKPDSPKWEDVLEMWVDLINCLSDEDEVAVHVSKLEVMKEGLYQVRDVLIDKNIGYKENRYQEHLVQKKLTKTLGHSSRCLFTLLLFYLYGSVRDIELEIRGGVHVGRGGNCCLYVGKVLNSDEEKLVWNAVKNLDRSLGLFKFVWEAAKMKGDLELQGHMWCFGADSRVVPYKGNMYFLHGINL